MVLFQERFSFGENAQDIPFAACLYLGCWLRQQLLRFNQQSILFQAANSSPSLPICLLVGSNVWRGALTMVLTSRMHGRRTKPIFLSLLSSFYATQTVGHLTGVIRDSAELPNFGEDKRNF